MCLGLDIWVSQVVKANFAQVVFAEEPAEVFGHIVGPQEFAALIHADVIEVILAVGVPEKGSVLLLPFFCSQQQSFHHRNQRERSETEFGFRHIFPQQHKLAVHIRLNDLVRDGDGLFLEVHSIPTQAQHLAAPQAIISGDLDAELQRGAGGGVKQVEHFLLAVERAMVDVFLGAVHLIGRVLGEDVLFYRALEGLADDGVVVNHGVGSAAVVEDALTPQYPGVRGPRAEWRRP